MRSMWCGRGIRRANENAHKELNLHTQTQTDSYKFTGRYTHLKHQNGQKHTASSYSPSSLNLTLSVCVSSANGYISARASPGLLSVSNGNSLGKVVLAKSPPPPSPQMVNSRKPDLKVITSQSGKSLMQLVRRRRPVKLIISHWLNTVFQIKWVILTMTQHKDPGFLIGQRLAPTDGLKVSNYPSPGKR